MLTVSHSEAEMEMATRLVNAMQINGTDAELLTREGVLAKAPLLNDGANARYPIFGGVWQGRAGVARHDAVAWGYARAVDAAGVDIVQECEVTGFMVENGRCAGVVTTRGDVHFVVTEFGVADLFGRTLFERARALISIAHPAFRDELEFAALHFHYLT